MCGIGGILRVWPAERRAEALATPHVRSIPEAWLDTIDESIKHRGPDGRGRFRDRAVRADGCVVDVALVHRRLSIIDHAGGHQPMLSLGRGMGVVGGKRLVLGGGLGLYERDAASELVGDGPGLDALIGASRVIESGHSDSSRPPHLSLTREAPNDRVCVVFNGCIYNHRELRAELQRAGHVFSTDHSDTEVLVHGWREWGLGELHPQETVPLRTGGLFEVTEDMFAAAVWDAARATLVLARDKFGQKPLYWTGLGRGELAAFSSSVPGLMSVLMAWEGRVGLRQTGVRRWVRFGACCELPVDGIEEVPPSAVLTLTATRPAPEWFDPREFGGDHFEGPWGELGTPRSGRFGPEAVDAGLRIAVRTRLETDVPLGCFLSGGVDSSLLAKYAVETVPKLRTFTVSMPDPDHDESRHAERVAELLGVRHSTLACHPDPATDLLAACHSLGLPFGDSSLLPATWVSRAARQEVAVVLSGDGGDELFGGYERYRGARLLGRAGLLLAAVRASADADPRSRRSRLARLAEAARNDGYADLVSIFPSAMLARLFGAAALSCGGGRVVGAEAAMDDDLAHYLPSDLLRKTDTASMGVALEARCPFLAPDVAGPASRALAGCLMPRGQRKGLLRQVARKYLPAEIVDRPKQGFAIPIGEWFRSDYGGLRTMLLDHLHSTEPFGPPSLGIELNMKYVRQMLDEHLGTGPSGRVVRDHSQRLYMLLVLSVWAKWLGGLSSK